MKKIILGINFLIVFAACGGKTDAAKNVDTTPFFDVRGFFQNEIKRLTEGGTKIEKTVTIGGKAETKII